MTDPLSIVWDGPRILDAFLEGTDAVGAIGNISVTVSLNNSDPFERMEGWALDRAFHDLVNSSAMRRLVVNYQSEHPGASIRINIDSSEGAESGTIHFGDQHIVIIATDQLRYIYGTTDGGYARFSMSHIIAHEFAHIFTDMDDGDEFNSIVNEIIGQIDGSAPRSDDYFDIIAPNEQCFGPEVPIDMWPLDPTLKPGPDGIYDQDEVRAKVWKKPIELIRVGDIVVSFDEHDNLVPGPVTRTMTNDAKILLDFHGTRVTPGHVYYRPDSKKSYKYETLIDVLRDDGMIKHQDGPLIRAATNVAVDSPRDGFVRAVAGKRKADGTFTQTDEGRIRLGTRFLVCIGKECKSFAVADLIEVGGGVVGDDELIRVYDGEPMPFLWDFGDTLPKPEDFVLACSGTTLEDIYKAAEWESQGPRLPAPMELDRGPVQPLTGAALSAMPRNEPLDVVHSAMASAKPQQTLNRKQRKAMEAKQRKVAKSHKWVMG